MQDTKTLDYIKEVLENIPASWLKLTTHRLDIYDESQAKTQFLDQFETLFHANNAEPAALKKLPTAYDYIRLGHPLSCILEWGIANLNNVAPENVITFSSKTVPILAILRKNLLANKKTQILYIDELPPFFDAEIVRNIYGYNFELKKVEQGAAIPEFNGSTLFISQKEKIGAVALTPTIDFFLSLQGHLGSTLIVNGEKNKGYISEIQIGRAHV